MKIFSVLKIKNFQKPKKNNPSQNNISKNSTLKNKNNEKIIKLEKTRDENIRSEINIRKNKTENKATSSLNSIVKKDEKKVQPTEKKQAINEKIFNKNNIDDNDVFVIGGESVYNDFLPYCNIAHITYIDYEYEADRHFLNMEKDENWDLILETEEETYFDIPYTFRLYKRNNRL